MSEAMMQEQREEIYEYPHLTYLKKKKLDIMTME